MDDDNNNFHNLETTRSRRGVFNESKLPAHLIRSYCISVRLNKDELSLLDSKRAKLNRAEWLRAASLHKLPTVIPPINVKAWQQLSEISQKLNKLIAHLDSKSQVSTLTQTELFAVKRQISELRLNLVTANLWGASSNEGNAEDQTW